MEYRRRRRVTHAPVPGPGRGGAAAAYAAVAIVFLGIVYLIGASKLSAWVAENWIAPVLKRSDPSALQADGTTPSPTPETIVIDELTQELKLPGRTFYAIQIGVYADRANADAQSLSLRAIGAAGCVLQDGERFRVLASAYSDKSDAQSVSAQLLAAGVENRLHTLSSMERTLTLTGTTQQLTSVNSAANGVDALLESLYALSIDFDKNQRSVAEGMAALTRIQAQADNVSSQLANLGVSSADGLGGLDTFYATVRDESAPLLAAHDMEMPAFSSGLKNLYLCAIQSLR